MPITPSKADEYLAFAHRLADAAGEVILPHFRTPVGVANKAASGFDPVTIADRDAETVIRTLIENTYPDHGILGEEHGTTRSRCGLTWVIDPIDGTRAFITGSPLWGTLIALNDGERPVIGLLDQPFLKERFCGTAVGERTQAVLRSNRNTRILRTRPCPSLEDAVLSTTTTEMFRDGSRDAFETLMDSVRLTRFGGDCYQYAQLAMGFLDLVVEARLAPYDIQALIPIIEGAGGVVTTWYGDTAADGGDIIAAGDRRTHEAALAILNGR